jgi:hypothetical protein
MEMAEDLQRNRPHGALGDPGEQDFGVLTDFVMIVTNDPLRPMRRLRVTAIIEE